MIYPYQEIEVHKRSLSSKAKNISGICWAIFATELIVEIMALVILINLGYSPYMNVNQYTLANSIMNSPTLYSIMGLVAIFAIVLIALIVLLFILWICNFQLGTRFQRLSRVTPELKGFYNVGAFIIAGNALIGIATFLPGYFGLAVSVLANLVIIVAFINLMQTFSTLQNSKTYSGGNTTTLIIIGYIIITAGRIAKTFVTFLSLISLFGYLFLALGFKKLARDIQLIQLPTTIQPQPFYPEQPVQPKPQYSPYVPPFSTPIQAQPEKPVEKTEAFCPSCGAKIDPDSKFCPYCGAKL